MARFGEILAELRQDRGLTQETLARRPLRHGRHHLQL